MEISAEKVKLMANSANGIQKEIKVKGQKLITVTSFKYLGAIVSDEGSKPEVLSRIAQATEALTKLKPVWRNNNISLGLKVKLVCTLVIRIISVCLWVIELDGRAREKDAGLWYEMLSNISYKDHVTNEDVCRQIEAAIEKYDELLILVKKRKLRWSGLISRSSGLAQTILQGTVQGKRLKVDRRRGG